MMVTRTRTARSRKNASVASAERYGDRVSAMVLGAEDDTPIWALIDRLVGKYGRFGDVKQDKDVQAICFLLAGAMGTIRRLQGVPLP